jgi:hypothetical protein
MSDNNEQKESEKEFKSLLRLVNPVFEFEFAGQKYSVKRANIEQVQRYQLKVTELGKKTDIPSSVRDLDIVVYAVFIILQKNYPDVTEDFVKENLPGNVDVISVLSELGFIDPQKAEMVKKLQGKMLSDASSQS